MHIKFSQSVSNLKEYMDSIGYDEDLEVRYRNMFDFIRLEVDPSEIKDIPAIYKPKKDDYVNCILLCLDYLNDGYKLELCAQTDIIYICNVYNCRELSCEEIVGLFCNRCKILDDFFILTT